MNTHKALDPKEYNVELFYASAPITWSLQSSSLGCQVIDPEGLVGAVTIERASNVRTNPIIGDDSPVNPSGLYEYVVYSSIRHMFYDDSIFVTSGLAPLPTHSYVVSIGQDFYADRIKPSSFTLTIDSLPSSVYDDGAGNLIVSESNGLNYIGRIFYEKGIAVVKTDTTASIAQVSGSGIKIESGSIVNIGYDSDVEIIQHQINVKLNPTDFNYSLLNPSMQRGFTPTGVSASLFTQSMDEKGIEPFSGSMWSLYRLMSADQIRPYVTTIGLYNDQYELLAVAKLSTPIQRTFESPQIFIIKFDT